MEVDNPGAASQCCLRGTQDRNDEYEAEDDNKPQAWRFIVNDSHKQHITRKTRFLPYYISAGFKSNWALDKPQIHLS